MIEKLTLTAVLLLITMMFLANYIRSIKTENKNLKKALKSRKFIEQRLFELNDLGKREYKNEVHEL